MSINYLFENIFDLERKKLSIHDIRLIINYINITLLYLYTVRHHIMEINVQKSKLIPMSKYHKIQPRLWIFQYVNIAASILLCFSICLHRLHFFLFPCHRFYRHIADYCIFYADSCLFFQLWFQFNDPVWVVPIWIICHAKDVLRLVASHSDFGCVFHGNFAEKLRNTSTISSRVHGRKLGLLPLELLAPHYSSKSLLIAI